MKKILVALAILTSISSHVFAYTYNITNKLTATVTVGVKPTLGKEQTQAIAPGQIATFKFTGIESGLCLNDGSITVNGNKIQLFQGGTGFELATVGEVLSFGLGSILVYCGDWNFDLTTAIVAVQQAK